MTTHSHLHRAAAVAAIVAQLAAVAPAFAVTPAGAPAPAAASPRAAASPLVKRAQGLYAQARYDEAVTALVGPVKQGSLKGTELRDARVLLARCYVKKGLNVRAKEYFAAVVAADPAFVLDAAHADAEELAVFETVKPPAPAAAPAPATGPAAQAAPPAGKPAPRKPNLGPMPTEGGSWIARHKLLAAAIAVGGGTAVAIAAGSGGSKGTSTPPSSNLPGFPPPPGH